MTYKNEILCYFCGVLVQTFHQAMESATHFIGFAHWHHNNLFSRRICQSRILRQYNFVKTHKITSIHLLFGIGHFKLLLSSFYILFEFLQIIVFLHMVSLDFVNPFNNIFNIEHLRQNRNFLVL